MYDENDPCNFYSDLNTVQGWLEARDFDINLKIGSHQCTVLHRAVSIDHLPIVELLLELGADVSSKESKNQTPLHYAFGYDCAYVKVSNEICKLLLQHKADSNDKDVDGNTPFLMALKNRCLNTIKMLLDYGADITAVNSYGMTASHFAAENREHVDVLEFILDRGFDIERCCNGGYSALSYAAYFRNPEGCKLLLKRGALVNVKSGVCDHTPLSMIIDSWHVQHPSEEERVLEVLLEHGADVGDVVQGKRILELAAEEGRCKAIRRILVKHLVKMQYQKRSIEEEDIKMLENNDRFEDYYQELQDMKEAKFYNNITLFNVLMDSDKVISGYARNHELVKALERNQYQKKFPIYFASLRKRFYIEVNRQKSRNIMAKKLAKLFKINDATNPVIQRIVSYI